MKVTARDTDAVARLGGDEFVSCCPTPAGRARSPSPSGCAAGWTTTRSASATASMRLDDLRRRRARARHRPDLAGDAAPGSRPVALQGQEPPAATGSSREIAPSMTDLITLARPRGGRARASRPSPFARRCFRVDHAHRAARRDRSGSSRRCCSAAARSSSAARTTSSRSSTPDERARGVIAPSSGNHAQAVALAAKLFGVPAMVVMPTTVTAGQARRRRATRRARRARGHDDARSLATRGRAGGRARDSRSCRRTTIRGSSRGRERSGSRSPRTCRDVGTVLVPVGGGGLSAGVATAIKLRAAERARDRRRAGERAEARRARARRDAGASRARRAVSPTVCSPSRSGTSPSRITSSTSTTSSRGRRRAARRDALPARPHEARRRAEWRDHRRGAARRDSCSHAGTTVAVLSGGNIEWDGLAPLLAE